MCTSMGIQPCAFVASWRFYQHRSTQMIKTLHPSLKACKCGYIGTRSELYRHFAQANSGIVKLSNAEFFGRHGEVPLNVDDPRVSLTSLEQQLAASLERYGH